MLDSYTTKEKKIFYTVNLIFVIFLVFRILSNNFFLSDSYEYLDVAQRISDFSFLSNSSDSWLETKRPFVYPLFLAIFNNFSIIVTLIIQTFVGILTFNIIFKILKKYNIDLKWSYLWFFILTPSIFIYTHLIMTEWLVMFFISLLFWILIQKWSKRNFAYIQIITILLAFTKPVFYPLIYLNLLFFAIFFIRNKTFSIWLFVPIIILFSYMSLNKVRTGYRHFSSMENINLINYNLYYFKVKTLSSEKADLWLDSIYSPGFSKMDFKDRSIYLQDIAKDELKQNFFQYGFYHFINSVRGVFDPGRFDSMTFFRNEDGNQGFLELLNKKNPLSGLLQNKFAYIYLLLIPIFLINLLKWFYFLRFLFFKRLDARVYYFILYLACYVLITGPVNCSRYMMPLQGVIIVFAILGMTKTKTMNKLFIK